MAAERVRRSSRPHPAQPAGATQGQERQHFEPQLLAQHEIGHSTFRPLSDQTRLSDPATAGARQTAGLARQRRDDAEAASGDRPTRRISTNTKIPTFTARLMRSPPARPTPMKPRAKKRARFLNAPLGVKEIIFVRGATEGINLVAQAWGRPQCRNRATRSSSPGSSITPISCPGNSSAPKPAPAARCAGGQ